MSENQEEMRIVMDEKTILARIDLLGLGISDTSKYILDEDALQDMAQALDALKGAYKNLSKGTKK